MIKKVAFCIVLLSFIVPYVAKSQVGDSVISRKDSLPDVIVHSFNYNKVWVDVPAAIGVLNNNQLQKIGTTNLLPAMNTIPGVRMEERSPESYRLSIRGSLLRSPFGVRDVKVYWNNLPITDGGGNTYLNLLDNTQINTIEVAKGPAASMYGASSGGMVLLQNKPEFSSKPTNNYVANINGGSFWGVCPGEFAANKKWAMSPLISPPAGAHTGLLWRTNSSASLA